MLYTFVQGFQKKNKHTYFLSLGKSFKNRNFWMAGFFCVWARFENHCQRLTFDVLQPLWPKGDLFCEWDFNNIWLYSLFQKNVSYSIMKFGTTAAYQDNIETLPVLWDIKNRLSTSWSLCHNMLHIHSDISSACEKNRPPLIIISISDMYLCESF